MADTIECPYCCNDPALKAGCRGCNGVGFIGYHAPDPAAREAGPDVPPAPLCQLVYDGAFLYALDMSGELWRAQPSDLMPVWYRMAWPRA